MSSMSESHRWYLFHKEVKTWDFTTCLVFDNFKTRLESGIFKYISWLNGSIFGFKRFLKKGIQTYQTAPM